MPRKHKGIIQKGKNKGKLKKGYKYTGEKTKIGLPIIKKCKRKYKQKGGNKSFINQIVGDNGVYVINLKQSTDRWESIKEQLEKRNITYTRVEATYGADQPLEELNKYRYTGTDKSKISKSEFGKTGCTMSHIKLWNSLKDKLKTDDDWALILEDDAFLIGDTNKYLEKSWKILPSDYRQIGIIYLNWCWPYNNPETINSTDVTHIKKSLGMQSTCAYMINKTGMEKLLKIPLPINTTIDHRISLYTSVNGGVYGISFKDLYILDDFSNSNNILTGYKNGKDIEKYKKENTCTNSNCGIIHGTYKFASTNWSVK